MTKAEFDYFGGLIYNHTGVVLDVGTVSLVEVRLDGLLDRHGFANLQELMKVLQANSWHPLHQHVIDAVLNHETSFFRDVHPFYSIRTHILPDLVARRSQERRLNVWSAGCSTGQEAYTIAISLVEAIPELFGWQIRILASDVSAEMLERTQMGCYSRQEVNRGLPAQMLVKYFIQDGLKWQVRDDIRRLIEVRLFSLAGEWPALPNMDIIFLRNVMIYFDLETKRSVLQRICRVLRPDGYLFVGGAETVLNLTDALEYHHAAKTPCYRLRNSGTNIDHVARIDHVGLGG